MNSTEPSYFSPPFPEADHPLSIRGRFGRLSFIAWSAFLQFIFLCSSIALGLSIDIVNIASLSVDSNWQISLHGLSSLFALAIMLVYLYFGIVITVRRLHDLDRSGWWMLLFFVPLINLFVWIYIVLFREQEAAISMVRYVQAPSGKNCGLAGNHFYRTQPVGDDCVILLYE